MVSPFRAFHISNSNFVNVLPRKSARPLLQVACTKSLRSSSSVGYIFRNITCLPILSLLDLELCIRESRSLPAIKRQLNTDFYEVVSHLTSKRPFLKCVLTLALYKLFYLLASIFLSACRGSLLYRVYVLFCFA